MSEITHEYDRDAKRMIQLVSPARLREILDADGDNYERPADFVVRVRTAEIVNLQGKVKFPRGLVVYCGDRVGAVAKIQKKHPEARAVLWGTATAGYYGTATAGDGGILQIRCGWDGVRYRIATAYVGEDDILADKKYRLDSQYRFVLVPAE